MKKLEYLLKISIVLIAVLVLGLACFGGYALWLIIEPASIGYKRDIRKITTQFEKIPNVSVLEAWGHEDISLENIWAKVEIENHGTLTFAELTDDSFANSLHIYLRSIGPYRVYMQGYGYCGTVDSNTGAPVKSKFWSDTIDIGTGGPLVKVLPCQVKSVRDTIHSYDKILAALAKWPTYPNKMTIVDDDETEYYFAVGLLENE